MRLRLDPQCPAVRSWREAEERDRAGDDLLTKEELRRRKDTVTAWEVRHADGCQRCSHYLTLDAELVLSTLISDRIAVERVEELLMAAGFADDTVSAALNQLKEAQQC